MPLAGQLADVQASILNAAVDRDAVLEAAAGMLACREAGADDLHGSLLARAVRIDHLQLNGLKLSLALTSSVLGYRFQHGWLYIALRCFGRSNGWHFGFWSILTGSGLRCFGFGYGIILL